MAGTTDLSCDDTSAAAAWTSHQESDEASFMGPDSMDLLLQDMDIPEDRAPTRKRQEANDERDPDEKRLRTDPSTGGEDFAAAFHCSASHFHSDGYVASGELALAMKGPDAETRLQCDEPVVLFGQNFRADAYLGDRSEVLLHLFCQRLSFLESEQEVMRLQKTQDVDWTATVEEIRQFLGHIRRTCYHLDLSIGLDRLLVFLHAVQLHAGKLSDLPSHVLLSSGGHQKNSFSSCLLHLLLDLRWTLYVSVSFLATRAGGAARVEHLTFCEFRGFRDMSNLAGDECDHRAPLAELSCQLACQAMHELVNLSLSRYRQLGIEGNPKKFLAIAPFGCSCEREIWLMLFKHVGKANSNLTWNYLRVLLPLREEDKEEDNQTRRNEVLGHVQYDFKTVPRQFVWWLVKALVPLVMEDRDGGRPEDRLASKVFFLSETWLADSSLLTEPGCDEPKARTNLLVLLAVSRSLGPSLPVLNFLWEHFQRHLNDRFCVGPVTTGDLGMLPQTSAKWLNMLQSEETIDEEDSANSYQLYLKLLHLQLIWEEDEELRRKLYDRVSSRMMSKLSSRKLKELSVIGWFHFLCLVIQMLRVSMASEATTSRWLKTVDSLKPAELKPQQAVVLLKGLGTMALLVSKPSQVLQVFMSRLEHLVNCHVEAPSNQQLGDACGEAMGVYADILKDTMCQNNVLTVLTETCLGACVARYLRVCRSVDILSKLISNFVVLVTKIRKLYKTSSLFMSAEETKAVEDVRTTEDALWKTIYPVVRDQLCSNSTTAACNEVAEFVTGMLLLEMDKPNKTTNFPELFNFFARSATVQPVLSCQVLISFLQQGPGVFEKLKLLLQQSPVNKFGCLDVVICGWLRCCVLMTPEEDASLDLLSDEVFKLRDLAQLDLSASHKEVNPAAGLEAFLKALGKLQRNQSSAAAEETRKVFGFYLTTCVECIKWAKKGDLAKEKLFHLYKVGAWLVEHCSNVLYCSGGGGCTTAVNLVSPILAELVNSNAMKGETFQFGGYQLQAIDMYLKSFVKGLSSIPRFHCDPFVKRALCDLYSLYLPRFSVKSHPLTCIFTNYIELDRKVALQRHFLEVVKSEFFDKSLPSRTKQQTLQQVLQFLFEMFTLAKSNLFLTTLGLSLLKLRVRIMGKDVFSQEQGVRLAAKKLLLELARANAQETAVGKDGMSPLLRQLVLADLPFHSKEVLQLLCELRGADRVLIAGLYAFVESEVTKLEAKRGLSQADSSLRELLRSLA